MMKRRDLICSLFTSAASAQCPADLYKPRNFENGVPKGYLKIPMSGFDVFHRGTSGPSILILHEMPGLTPASFALGERLEKAGFQVYMPRLFGKAGSDSIFNYFRSCTNKSDWACRSDVTSPIVKRLRPLAAEIGKKSGAPGIGVIGNCLTGIMPLAMLGPDSPVIAPVLCQPALPFRKKDLLALSPDDLANAKKSNAPIFGLRFMTDSLCPRERFERLCKEFPDRFHALCINNVTVHDKCHNGHHHAVLTDAYSDVAGSSTRIAYEAVVQFLKRRLVDPALPMPRCDCPDLRVKPLGRSPASS